MTSTSDDIIRYDILVQNALRGVIQRALQEVQKTGLPGNHHFFITFMTAAPGVRVSNRIREQYPEQMTIVLQHQYWDLEVGDSSFSVGLSFSDIPEMLHVPYSAIRGFYDPSVNFELEFDVEVADDDVEMPNGDGLQVESIAPGDTTGKKKPAAKPGGLPAPENTDGDDGSDDPGDGADVVSLDAFRKKK